MTMPKKGGPVEGYKYLFQIPPSQQYTHRSMKCLVECLRGHEHPCRVGPQHKGGLSISEDDQTDSDASSTADANEHMAAADMQIMRCQQDRVTNFTESLINLVSQAALAEYVSVGVWSQWWCFLGAAHTMAKLSRCSAEWICRSTSHMCSWLWRAPW